MLQSNRLQTREKIPHFSLPWPRIGPGKLAKSFFEICFCPMDLLTSASKNKLEPLKKTDDSCWHIDNQN